MLSGELVSVNESSRHPSPHLSSGDKGGQFCVERLHASHA